MRHMRLESLRNQFSALKKAVAVVHRGHRNPFLNLITIKLAGLVDNPSPVILEESETQQVSPVCSFLMRDDTE